MGGFWGVGRFGGETCTLVELATVVFFRNEQNVVCPLLFTKKMLYVVREGRFGIEKDG